MFKMPELTEREQAFYDKLPTMEQKTRYVRMTLKSRSDYVTANSETKAYLDEWDRVTSAPDFDEREYFKKDLQDDADVGVIRNAGSLSVTKLKKRLQLQPA